MISISLTIDLTKKLLDNYIIELPRVMLRPIHLKVDDSFIEEKAAKCITLNIWHLHQLMEGNSVRLNSHNTDILIDVIFEEKPFPASGCFFEEINKQR